MPAAAPAGEDWVVVGSKGKPRRPRTPSSTAAGAAAQPSPAGSSQQGTPARTQYPPCPTYPSSFDAPLRDWTAESPPTQPYRRPSKGPQTDAMRLAAQLHTLQLNRYDVQGAPVCGELQRAMSLAAERLQFVAQQQQQTSDQQDGQQDKGVSSSSPAAPSASQWAHVPDMVVYGLGSIEESRNARFQLALATLLQQMLPGLIGPPQVFDPVFSQLDKRVLAQLGMQLIERDEAGGRAVCRPTFFYLPHCEAPLCNNLLAANWSQEQLPMVVILGNSFQSYHERWNAPGARGNRPERLLQLVEAGVVVELPVRDHGFHVASAFNDMSLHVFPAELVQQHAAVLFK